MVASIIYSNSGGMNGCFARATFALEITLWARHQHNHLEEDNALFLQSQFCVTHESQDGLQPRMPWQAHRCSQVEFKPFQLSGGGMDAASAQLLPCDSSHRCTARG